MSGNTERDPSFLAFSCHHSVLSLKLDIEYVTPTHSVSIAVGECEVVFAGLDWWPSCCSKVLGLVELVLCARYSLPVRQPFILDIYYLAGQRQLYCPDLAHGP